MRLTPTRERRKSWEPEKINEVHTLGSLGVAGVLGLMTGSWTVFVITGVVLIGAGIYSGEIRYTNHNHQSRKR